MAPTGVRRVTVWCAPQSPKGVVVPREILILVSSRKVDLPIRPIAHVRSGMLVTRFIVYIVKCIT